MVSGVGGGEEFQSQEDKELNEVAGSRELILKMNSENQTVDHTNMIMGNHHDTIFVWFHTGYSTRTHKLWKLWSKGQWLCTDIGLDMYTHVHTNFDQQNPTTTSLVRPYSSIPVISSQTYWYEPSGLGCHPNTMSWNILEIRRMKFRVNTWQTRQSTDRIT